MFFGKFVFRHCISCYGKLFKSLIAILSMRVKKMTEVIGAKVYADSGDYFGEIEEANLQDNKVDGWKIKVSGGMATLISGARGVIIPHKFVRAISDIFIINKSALPSSDSEIQTEEII
jgi:sporulation protein YlmC with PRC-barrel domain|tara:strand:- start:40 stop:393 length:354 start_codon:yes stop_codon:yes gene_type:complete